MFGNVFTACWIGYYVTIVFYCYMQKGQWCFGLSIKGAAFSNKKYWAEHFPAAPGGEETASSQWVGRCVQLGEMPVSSEARWGLLKQIRDGVSTESDSI